MAARERSILHESSSSHGESSDHWAMGDVVLYLLLELAGDVLLRSCMMSGSAYSSTDDAAVELLTHTCGGGKSRGHEVKRATNHSGSSNKDGRAG